MEVPIAGWFVSWMMMTGGNPILGNLHIWNVDID